MSNHVTTHSSEMTARGESCFRIYNGRKSYLETKLRTNKQSVSLRQTDLKATRTPQLAHDQLTKLGWQHHYLLLNNRSMNSMSVG